MKVGVVEGREGGGANAGGGTARRGRRGLEATVDMGGEGISCIEGESLESVACFDRIVLVRKPNVTPGEVCLGSELGFRKGATERYRTKNGTRPRIH